ncbi:MAG TPA: IMP dehydrogenase [Patescibacteria group bacterium]|nr:IMP dehydrogenase [Patescibacteria group bacterium]
MEPSNRLLPSALTFNDVLLLPGFSDFSREEINLETNITKNLRIKSPFVSSPMDTVTEAPLAIALAKLGGIGIIHRNFSPEKEALEIKKVKDKNLLVGAAIGPNPGFETRLELIIKAGVDVVVLDSAHGWTNIQIETLSFIKKKYPKLQVVAGNIATEEGAIGLIKAGADALRVGMGPGAICTTRVVSGMGVPQFTALIEVAKAAKKMSVPIMADAGMNNSGDMVKALATGSNTLMMGRFFASTLESPGKKVSLSGAEVPQRFKSIFSKNGKFIFKEYRGMGSEAAMRRGAKTKSEGEFHGKSYKDRTLVAEGVEGLVPIKGTVEDVINIAIGGIKSGFYYCGFRNIQEAHKGARFIQITQASLQESHPHDILVTNAGKSYS